MQKKPLRLLSSLMAVVMGATALATPASAAQQLSSKARTLSQTAPVELNLDNTIANSSISNLVNLSDETSSVYVTLSFERRHHPEDLQRIIDARLDEELAGNRHFLEVPYYLGIVSMDTIRYTIAITGKCLQNEKSRAERELNRVLVGIMDEVNNGESLTLKTGAATAEQTAGEYNAQTLG